MRTPLVIGGIVLAALLTVVAGVGLLVWWLGPWFGIGVTVAAVIVLVVVYLRILQPWHARWGATDAEVARSMPGDDLLAEADSTTRAITIAAPPDQVWPWLVQIGYGKAGWYSYDWIDNDGRPSADRIVPAHQGLKPGDQILMMPGMGPIVTAVEPCHSIVSASEDGRIACPGAWASILQTQVAPG